MRKDKRKLLEDKSRIDEVNASAMNEENDLESDDMLDSDEVSRKISLIEERH